MKDKETKGFNANNVFKEVGMTMSKEDTERFFKESQGKILAPKPRVIKDDLDSGEIK